MSSQKCPDCGLVNWSDATFCKRCKTPLQDLNEADYFARPTLEGEKPATFLGLLMVGWGLLLLAAALYLLSLGSTSPVLVGGPAILLTGIFVMRGRQGIFGLYFLGVLVMSGWLGVTHGLAVGIGSFLFPGLVGLLVVNRRYPVLAGFLIILSCVSVIGTFAFTGVLLRSSKVAWRGFRAPQTSFTVQMPSEPIVRDPIVAHRGLFIMTKNVYESRIPGQGSTLYVKVDYVPSLPPGRVSYEEILDGEVDAIAAGTSSTVLAKKRISVSGHTGLEVEMKPPDNLALKSPKTFIKLFMNSDHLYLMQLTASQPSELLDGKDTFLTPQFSY